MFSVKKICTLFIIFWSEKQGTQQIFLHHENLEKSKLCKLKLAGENNQSFK